MSAPPTPVPIAGRALLVSNDSTAVERIPTIMSKFAILPEVCPDVATARSLVNIRKYEAIMVDLAFGEQVANLLERVRFSPSNQNSVTFVIGSPGEHAEPRVQPNFFIEKPLNDSLVESTLRAALGLIIRDYRRYFRCAVALPVTVQIDEVGLACEMLNISEGGLAVKTATPFRVGAEARVQFMLPGEPAPFDLQSDICWSDNKGRAGQQFRSVPPDQKSRLQDWLSRRIEQGLPEHVARLFQKEKR